MPARSDTIHLGFEVGTGEPVSIPLRHMAVTGQTQESGKTTTLEALVSRAGVSALAFVTKRGERSFTDGRRIRPYFRDRADWQFVTSIMDATLQEKNKFLRPWIMKICRTTRTLAEVQTKVREALKTAKGINEGVYTQLDEYLELIVPEIRRTPLAPTLDITRRGLSVMDVSASPTPMQMLLVQSALDWVNEHAEHTVVVVPEAWEFIPEGKGSPAKASAVSLVRKGAGIGNHIWVDSQDMAGVDKTILRGCAVWLIGVQREANEIKRNLASIPAGIKRPTASAIAMLERGEFFACWGTHAVKTYVQPAWMNAAQAQQVATGALTRDVATQSTPKPVLIEDTVNEREAAALRAENEDLRERIVTLEQRLEHAMSSNAKGPESAPVSGRRQSGGDAGSTPAMASARTYSADESLDNEQLYQAFKTRLISELPSDPRVMRIVVSRPELEVQVARKTITMDENQLSGRVAILFADGWFDEVRGASTTAGEMKRRGWNHDYRHIDRACRVLAEQGFFRIESGKGFVAVAGMKVNIVER